MQSAGSISAACQRRSRHRSRDTVIGVYYQGDRRAISGSHKQDTQAVNAESATRECARLTPTLASTPGGGGCAPDPVTKQKQKLRKSAPALTFFLSLPSAAVYPC